MTLINSNLPCSHFTIYLYTLRFQNVQIVQIVQKPVEYCNMYIIVNEAASLLGTHLGAPVIFHVPSERQIAVLSPTRLLPSSQLNTTVVSSDGASVEYTTLPFLFSSNFEHSRIFRMWEFLIMALL